jgi:murein DD-endopeptidase MepM/ murein hydrolase activator NlpD
MSKLETLFLQVQNSKVIDSSIPYSDYTSIDLSVSNEELSKIDLGNPILFEKFIESHLQNNNAKVAYGGYNEIRNLYRQNNHFNDSEKEERNIHIGLDLWIKAGTNVLAVLDGMVYGFDTNSGKGNYGPTIILKHELENQEFYTLYGHLSQESIANIKIGTFFKKGEILGTLGDATVNGGYAPHLHFQIIENIANNRGDYPGVCSKNDLYYYLENCPDPNLILKIR